jgi:YesN/AraC family two-component response regulator
VNRAIDIIINEYADPNLSSDSLAEKLGLTSNYLREIFRELMGMTMSNYINEFRCEKASEMLLETNYSIAEISERIGLSNQNYFFTLFKKFRGLTPQQYRLRAREKGV